MLKWGNCKQTRCVKIIVKSAMKVKVKRTSFRVETPQTPQKNCGLNRASNLQPEAVKSLTAEGVNARDNSGHSSLNRIHTRAFYGNNGCSSTEDQETDTMQEKACCLEVSVWPKVVIALLCKEREEDFMAIKRSKLPQRPKKRAKFIQRNLLVVSPGSWLCDLSQERYEVLEKKSTNRKRARGLKALGNVDSDSD